MFMTLIMINFMIAVIMDTYDAVTLVENKYKYQGRAKVNSEYFELIKYCPKFLRVENDDFRLIIF